MKKNDLYSVNDIIEKQANALEKSGRNAEALNMYLKITTEKRNIVEKVINLSRETGNSKMALKYIDGLLNKPVDENNYFYRSQRIKCLLDLNRRFEALNELKDMEQNGMIDFKATPSMYKVMADLLKDYGDKQKAMEIYDALSEKVGTMSRVDRMFERNRKSVYKRMMKPQKQLDKMLSMVENSVEIPKELDSPAVPEFLRIPEESKELLQMERMLDSIKIPKELDSTTVPEFLRIPEESKQLLQTERMLNSVETPKEQDSPAVPEFLKIPENKKQLLQIERMLNSVETPKETNSPTVPEFLRLPKNDMQKPKTGESSTKQYKLNTSYESNKKVSKERANSIIEGIKNKEDIGYLKSPNASRKVSKDLENNRTQNKKNDRYK